MEELLEKMKELAQYATQGVNYNEELAEEYYSVKRLYDVERARVNKELNEKAKQKHTEHVGHFVNSYGEATHREITSTTYKRQQSRLSKEMLKRLS